MYLHKLPRLYSFCNKSKTNSGNVDYILSPNVKSTSFYLPNSLYKKAEKEKKKEETK